VPNKIVQEWADVEGGRVCFERAGSGPALVLVHGLLGYSFSWRFALPLLAQDHEVLALDMPGSGFSDCRVRDYSLRATAGRLLEFMSAVGVSSCDLVGSSYGGSTAMMAAILAPKRIRSLVLVSPANPWSRIGRKRLGLLRNPLLAAVFPKVARPFRSSHAYFHRRMYGDPRRIAPDTIEGYQRALAQRGVLEHAVRIVRSWHEDMDNLQNSLPVIADLPTLLVWGSKDRVVDPASAELLRNQFRNAETVVIEGAGHLPYEECPEEFSQVVHKFLTSHLVCECERKVT